MFAGTVIRVLWTSSTTAALFLSRTLNKGFSRKYTTKVATGPIFLKQIKIAQCLPIEVRPILTLRAPPPSKGLAHGMGVSFQKALVPRPKNVQSCLVLIRAGIGHLC